VWRSWGSGASRWKGSTWSWGPLDRGAGIDARTTQSPAFRGASLQCAGGWTTPPAATHSNAYYAAEVQSVLHPEIRSHVLGKPGRNDNQPALRPTLNLSPPLTRPFQLADALLVGGWKSNSRVQLYGGHPMVMEIIVHPGVDSAFIAWRASFIDQCRGFALKQKSNVRRAVR
jgi:hypothetical protein